MAKFEAIIFDCDGVLVDSEVVGLAETTAYLQSKGFRWTAADIVREFTGMHMASVQVKFADAYAQILGRTPAEQELGDLYQGFVEERRKQRHKMALVPGAMEMAKLVTQLPLAIAVASSSQAHFLNDKMQRYELSDMFAPHIYSADLVAAGKPAPDIFVYTADQIGIAPDKCLVIEDSAHGVTAGCRAGMNVWGFTGGGHCFDGHGDMLIAAGARCVVENHQTLTRQFQTLL